MITTPTVTLYNLDENDGTGGQNVFPPIAFVVTDADGDLTDSVTATQTPATPANRFVWLTTRNDGATVTGELRATSGEIFDYDTDPVNSYDVTLT